MHPAVYQYHNIVESGLVKSDPWMQLPEKTKQIATSRRSVVCYLDDLITKGSMKQALSQFMSNHSAKTLPGHVSLAIEKLGKLPGKSTLRNWVLAYSTDGVLGLAPKYSGTAREVYGWETRAMELYHRPQKPSISKVARDLRELYGFCNAHEHNVRYFFSTLPADLQDKSPWRMGRKQYKDGLREHIKRTTETLPVGFLYQGDGHTIDTYLKHPRTGKIWRPELTVFMDIKSRFIPGWYLSVAESSVSTMATLSHAMSTHNHVPAMVHIDNGSGFKSKMMNSETAGFYKSFSIDTMFAIPGNAKAKNVERWFRTMEDDFGKDWSTYCGYDMSPDSSRHFSAKKLLKLEKEGKIKVATVEEYLAKFEDWLARYHNRPHPEYKDTTPAEMWATLENVPVVDHNRLVRPREDVNVKKSLIRLHGRYYRSEFLYQLEGKKLIAEYDLHDDSTIRIFDLEGKWLTTAELKHRKDYLSRSRIEDAEVKRLEGQITRIEDTKREKIEQMGSINAMHEVQAKQITAFNDSLANLAQSQQPQNDEEVSEFDIDAANQAIQQKRQNDNTDSNEFEFAEPDFMATNTN